MVAVSSEAHGMNGVLEVARPWFLLFALLLPLLVVLQRRSLADLTPLQRRVCFALRAFILLLLILALVGVRSLQPSRELALIFAIDDSASVSAEARKKARDFVASAFAQKSGGDALGVVGFAADSQLWQAPLATGSLDASWPELKNRKATAIGEALDFASAIVPTGKTKRLVLLSDGNDTGDQAGEVAARLGQAGYEIFSVPLRNTVSPEVLVQRVDIPRQLKENEPFELVATIRSSVATSAKVKLYERGFLLEQRDIELQPGANEFRAPNLRPEGNTFYEVEVSAAQDTALENNRAKAVATLRGQPRVLIVDSDETKSRPLADVLRGEKIKVETRGATGLPRGLDDLQQYDLLVLSDVSALAMGREQMELYRRWVQDFGGGFLLIGGENSFGVGGYYRTPIEQMLPVRMEHEDRLDTPSVALLVVLDRSGSMTAQVDGQTKMSLANQGAVYAMNVLQPRDFFGVTAVDTRPHTVAALQQIGGKGAIEQKILSITAGGGGIYVYTSLVDAFQQLRDIPARIKHIILFSDAADAEEKNAGEMGDGARGIGTSFDVAAAMVAAKITTSVVALGSEQDKDTAFLRQLAERGSGRFYLTGDATTLPQIFSTETMKVAQSSLVEEPFLAVPVKASPITAGIDWTKSPLLLGYNATKPKPTGDLLLATERGEPLFATWRYGLGQAAAFTSDAKSRWAAEWIGWPGYGKFWAQAVRGLMRKSDQASFEVTTREIGERLELLIEAVTPEGEFRNELPITINVSDEDGATRTATAQQLAPGSYRATLDLPPEGTSILSVSSPTLPDGAFVIGHTRSYPREYLSTETNEPLLREIARLGNGTFDPRIEELFARPRQASLQPREMSDWFLIAALCLFPLDIWLRRRTWAT
jgi:Ca-activated chloride channel family protein